MSAVRFRPEPLLSKMGQPYVPVAAFLQLSGISRLADHSANIPGCGFHLHPSVPMDRVLYLLYSCTSRIIHLWSATPHKGRALILRGNCSLIVFFRPSSTLQTIRDIGRSYSMLFSTCFRLGASLQKSRRSRRFCNCIWIFCCH